eukprot:s666_g1.t1
MPRKPLKDLVVLGGKMEFCFSIYGFYKGFRKGFLYHLADSESCSLRQRGAERNTDLRVNRPVVLLRRAGAMPAPGQQLQRSRSWLRKDRGLEKQLVPPSSDCTAPSPVVSDGGVDTYALQGPDVLRLPHQLADLAARPPRKLLRTASDVSEPMAQPDAALLVLHTELRNLVELGKRWWLREVTNDKLLGKGLYEVVSGLVLFASSGLDPLPATQDLADAEEIWVEQNLQFIRRIRDIEREQGFASYNLTAHPAMQTGKWKFRRAWD